jgi:predicted NUDIX family phosphoesterase/dephospho-CoA kinase
MRVEEIVAQAQDGGLFSDEMYSVTPQKSMQARLSMEIVRNGESSRFVRTAKGVFFLRSLLKEHVPNSGNVGSLPLPSSDVLRTFNAKPRRPKQTIENVLVIPATACREHLIYQGMARNSEAQLKTLFSSEVRHMPRTSAEETEDFKQVITYVLVTYRSRVLSFRRGRFNRAAQFLRGSLCIGFGGHVTDEDYSLFTTADFGIRDNAARELGEEIRVGTIGPIVEKSALQFRGLINDNSTSLGRKHLGVVFQYEVPDEDWPYWINASRNEMSINQLKWIDTETESTNLVEFEYWSQLCWRVLSPKTVGAQAEYRVLRKKPFQAPHILAVVGGIGSGKSSATQVLQGKFGYSNVNSGRVLANLLEISPVPETPRKQFQKIAWNFISMADGPRYLADALYDEAMKHGGDRVIIDGIRQLATLDALRMRSNGSLAVLFVYATPDLALRLYCRREGMDEADYESEFNEMIGAPVEADVQKMMNGADAVIYNWSGEANFEHAITSMARELKLKLKTGGKK